MLIYSKGFKMKKTILAVAVFASLLSGCMTTGGQASYADLQAQGQELYLESAAVGSSYVVTTADGTEEERTVAAGYQASNIVELENIRTIINVTFLTAKPVYERFSEEMINNTDVGNYFAAVDAAETDEEKAKVYTNLSPEKKQIIKDFENSSVGKELLIGLKDVAFVILKNSTAFTEIDTMALISNVDFSEIMAEKDRLGHTTDQLLYMNDTVVSAYKNYQVISAMNNAE